MKIIAISVTAFTLAMAAPAYAAGEPDGFSVETIISGLKQPTAIDFLPDGRLIYTTRAGAIHIVDPAAPSTSDQLVASVPASVGDGIPDSELGLTGMAVDPDYSTNGFVYVWHSVDTAGTHRLSRVQVVNDTADLATITTMWETPETMTGTVAHHVGGGVAFGPDGNLYFSIGDRGSWVNAQAVTNSSGAIHRIRPDGTIPEDNPFYDGEGPNVDSIFTYGHRNPFRLRWDLPTQSLYVAEVGRNSWEEINTVRLEEPGRNYEWSICEGDAVHAGPGSACTRSFVAEFARSTWVTVTTPRGAVALGLLVAGSVGLAVAWRRGLLGNRYTRAAAALLAVLVVGVVAVKAAAVLDRVRSFEAPIFTYQHDVVAEQPDIPDTPLGASISGGVVNRSDQFPSALDGAYFFGDFMNGWVSYLTFEDPEDPTYHPFSENVGGIVDVHMSPDGDLYYLSLFSPGADPAASGSIVRVRYEGGLS